MDLSEIREFILSEPDVDKTRSPGDKMFVDSEEQYYGIGLSALRVIRLALICAGRTGSRRILDLPCGHGRVMRYLRAEFPDAEIVGCELERDGADYCAKAFGAIPIYSDPDLTKVEIDGTFDLIFSGSLVTHFGAPQWLEAMRLFESVLEPGGLLVFTTHGRTTEAFMRNGLDYAMRDQLENMLAAAASEGFAYNDYEHMPGANWGISLSRPHWVVRGMEAFSGLRLLSFTEGGWMRHQDVAVYEKLRTDRFEGRPSADEF